MTARLSTEQARSELKAAVRAQVRASGGQASAADITRVSQQTLSRYGSPNHPDEHAPIDVLLDLILDTSDAVVLRRLCQLAGGAFVPLSKFGADADVAAATTRPAFWAKVFVDAVGRGGKMAEVFSAAFADDGDVSPQEIRDLKIRETLADAIEALVVMDRVAAQVEGEGEGL